MCVSLNNKVLPVFEQYTVWIFVCVFLGVWHLMLKIMFVSSIYFNIRGCGLFTLIAEYFMTVTQFIDRSNHIFNGELIMEEKNKNFLSYSSTT